jgi:uncharacterized protein YbjT (DUF2867 family)
VTQTTAVLAGASGLVGGYCLQLLLDDAYYDKVISVGRRILPVEHPKLTQRVADFDALLDDDLLNVTHVFCCLGTTIRKAGNEAAFRRVDHDYPLALARKAASLRARRFLLVSSVGADPKSGTFYLRVKGELEEGLRALPFEGLYLFQPSILLGPRQEERPGERTAITLARAFEWTLVAGLRKYRPMPAPVLARAMTAAGERAPSGTHAYRFDEIVRLAG